MENISAEIRLLLLFIVFVYFNLDVYIEHKVLFAYFFKISFTSSEMIWQEVSSKLFLLVIRDIHSFIVLSYF